MKQFRFMLDGRELMIEANTYEEALAGLVFKVGGEADASRWIFTSVFDRRSDGRIYADQFDLIGVESPDDINDRIRTQVNEELPRPIGGFETDTLDDELRLKRDARFMALVNGGAR